MRDLKKLKSSLKELEHALSKLKKSKVDILLNAAIAKLFEVCFAYAWKALKDKVQESGLEAYSPRDVIKAAGRAGILDDVESWMEFLEDRNLSVHDYIGVSDKDYLLNIEKFVKAIKKILAKLN